VLSRPFSDEGKSEPGRFIALFLDLAQINKALFIDLAIGHKGFLTFAGLLPDGRMVLPGTTARTDVEREFFTKASAWNTPRDIPKAQGMILLKGIGKAKVESTGISQILLSAPDADTGIILPHVCPCAVIGTIVNDHHLKIRIVILQITGEAIVQ